MSAFASDKFRFLRLEMSGAKVLAMIKESQGFASQPVHTVEERQVHRWLQRTLELIRAGEDGKTVHRNLGELTAAFNAIRTYKAQNNIPLDVERPCI